MTSSTALQPQPTAIAPQVDLLRRVVVRVPCVACGSEYGVTLRQILLAQQLAHHGCPARYEPECPPVVYGKLANEGALRAFDESWRQLVDAVRASGLELTF